MADEEGQEDELLVLESIYEDERIFMRSPNEKGGQLNISVELPDDFFLIIRSTYVPKTLRKTTPTQRKDGVASNDDFTNIQAKYLPPIVMNFEFPTDYPSTSPPRFTLSCKWLTRVQISKLCESLDKIWEEQGPCEIIYSWDSCIKEDALKLLKIQSPYKLHFTRRTNKQIDQRAIQDVGSYATMVKAVLDFDKCEIERVFESQYVPCAVCFEDKLGSVCMRFYDCGHVFCCECLSAYFTVQINDGSVKNLTCPTDKCESQAQPSQVKSLVSPELYRKYDEFLLQTTLDMMEDLKYCPRTACQQRVMIEKDSTIGICPDCKYVFCIFCKKASHGIEACSIKDEESKKLRDAYMKANEQEKSLMERQYGKQRLQRVFEEVVSIQWLKENAKQCPKCGFNIQKTEGCNHMTCRKCRSHFCWLCNELLPYGNPYLHFNVPGEECFNRLFEGEDALMDDDDDDFDGEWW